MLPMLVRGRGLEAQLARARGDAGAEARATERAMVAIEAIAGRFETASFQEAFSKHARDSLTAGAAPSTTL